MRTKFYIRSFTDSEIFGGTLKILEAKFLCLIILMAPSVEGLQRLLTVCEDELITLDMKINVKSLCVLGLVLGMIMIVQIYIYSVVICWNGRYLVGILVFI